jgi:hypothetical protein
MHWPGTSGVIEENVERNLEQSLFRWKFEVDTSRIQIKSVAAFNRVSVSTETLKEVLKRKKK